MAHRTILAVPVVLMLSLALPVGALGQHEHTDPATASHPMHIHTGVCPVPGTIVGPMSDVSAVPGQSLGATDAIPVETARSKVDLAMWHLVGTDHAVVVHRSHDDMAALIACGDIGGPMASPGQLIIGLGPVEDSGYAGIAILTDGGDGTTTVEVFLAHWGIMAPSASPSPSPTRKPYGY